MKFRSFPLYRIILLLLLPACSTMQHARMESRQYAVNSALPEDSAADAYILPFRQKLEKEMNEVIGYSLQAMPKLKDAPESALGNFVADLVLQTVNRTDSTHADICLLNIGGLRTSLPQGAVTRGNIFELMPFENELVVVTISYDALDEMFRYLAAFPQPVAGMHLCIADGKVTDAFVNGVVPDSTKKFRVVTSDYLANGGDSMKFLGKGERQVLGIKLRDAILYYILAENEAGRQLRSATDRRINPTHP